MTATRLATIVSTGDAGAARGALEAADELGLKVGGWTAVTTLPPAYTERLRATLAPRMAARLNVQDSDGTLIVSFAPELTAGGPAAYADEAVAHQRKPALHIVLPGGGRSDLEDVRKAVLGFVTEEKIATLHVTGPREADEPGIQQAVRDALVWIFEDEAAFSMPEQSTPVGPSDAACACGHSRADHDWWGSGPCGSCDCAAFSAAALSDAEVVRLAAELAEAGGRPTHLAINPANVDAAIAAGLEVVEAPPGAVILQPVGPGTLFKTGKWLQPPPVPPEVYAARDRLLCVDPAGPERAPRPGEFDSCSCPSHVDQDGNVTRRPADPPPPPAGVAAPDHDYLSAGDTPYASGDRCYTGCFLCSRPRREHRPT